MLTDDELAAIRARCDAAQRSNIRSLEWARFMDNAIMDVRVLLDALEKARSQVKAANNDVVERMKQNEALRLDAITARGERNRATARAEALERFVQEARATHLYPCTGCVHQPAGHSPECKWEPGCWVFDEARYAKGGGES